MGLFSKNDALFCPTIGRACIKDKCTAWQVGIVEERVSGELTLKPHGGCTQFFWVPMFLKAIANRTDATQAAVESLRNVEALAGAQVAAALRDVASKPRQLKDVTL